MAMSLKKRVEDLERQVARLQERQNGETQTNRAWIDDLFGKFAGDPLFKQAMSLGKKYRRSLRPGSGKRKANS